MGLIEILTVPFGEVQEVLGEAVPLIAKELLELATLDVISAAQLLLLVTMTL